MGKMSSEITKAIVVEVNLSNTLLEHGDDVVKGAKAVRINRTARMRIRDRNNCVVSAKCCVSVPSRSSKLVIKILTR
jgi:hypothetical protein